MEDNMEEDDHSSSSEEEEEEWFDYLIRRPNDADLQRSARELPLLLLAPTKVFTSTYPKARRNGSDIELVLRGYEGNSDQAMLSSGLTEWQTSDVLCKYLLNNDEIKNGNRLRLLELGAGLGKCGLLLHHLLRSNGKSDSTVLTDGDKNVIQLLRKNVAFNTDDNSITCQQLQWGGEEAQSFLSKQDHNAKFDLIIGSDLLYTNRQNIEPLFETIGVLLEEDEYRYSRSPTSSRVSAKFILAHDEQYSVPVKNVVFAASQKDLFCEVVKQEGTVSVLCFKLLDAMSVNKVVDKLQAKIMMLEAENQRQKARMEQVEDKCLKLDKRCTVLRGDKDLPTSIILFDEDNLAAISSYLEPRDFTSLASTCKRFGAKTHRIEDEDVSLMKKIAHKIYESASLEEKDGLPNHQQEDPFILYSALLDLRKPLKFDRLLGKNIEHFEDKSIIKSQPLEGFFVLKVAPGTGRVFKASTAISNHVMRSGKHYVIFTCSDLSLEQNSLLWFGIVRPLNQIIVKRSMFTPFCGDCINNLRQLKCPEWGDSNIHACVYKATDGHCQSTDWETRDDSRIEPGTGRLQFFKTDTWEGMQGIPFEGKSKIGLLLDCDRGTLTVYKNDIKLGVMKSGLSGAYCWMVSAGESSKAKIKIERGPLPQEALSTLGKRERTE